MSRSHRFTLPIVGSFLLLLSACSGDTSDSGNPPDSGDLPSPGSDETPAAGPVSKTATLRTELAGIQAKLGPLQEQAMQDPALQEEYRQLEKALEEAMVAWDPEVPEHRRQLSDLQEQYQAAQEAGDEEKTKALVDQGRALNTKLQQARSRALSNEDVVAKMEGFQDHVLEKMAEIDPDSRDLIDRANTIANELSGGSPEG